MAEEMIAAISPIMGLALRIAENTGHSPVWEERPT